MHASNETNCSKTQLRFKSSHLYFLLFYYDAGGRDNRGVDYNACIMDRYLRHLLAKSEAAVSSTCQLILSGP